MAAFMLARVSAQKSGQTLFYAQAVDQAQALIQRATNEEFYEELLKIPSLSSTKRLPAVVLWHHGMRMKFTTTLQQPFAVQDVECTVVGFEPDDKDYDAKAAIDAQHCQGERVCAFMPRRSTSRSMMIATTTFCLQHLALCIDRQVTTLLV